ncbi:hypothetical protein BYT27DRAFT_7171042 [Phlegmacium glaucopus]|nr:hypothetical protein BYT27DRAFT_7171042 [Phlegmacium glaucopus]
MASTTGDNLPVNIVRGTHEQLVAFLVFNMWPSHFGIPLLLGIVLFSKNIKRHPTFVNICVAHIIIGISSSLLVYAGRTTGPEPSKMLCLLQASLLYGTPALASTTAFVLILQMFLMIRTAFLEGEYHDRDHPIRLWVMLITPYIAFFTSVLATAIIGSQRPSHVSRGRRFFYCSLRSLPLTNAITVYAAITLFFTIVTIACTIRILYNRWKATRSNLALRLKWTTDLSLPFRIITFGIYITVAMSLSLLSISAPSSPVPDLVIASAATVMLLIFGTQSDILSVLFFWVGKKPPRPVSKDYHIRIDFQQAYERWNTPETTVAVKLPNDDPNPSS